MAGERKEALSEEERKAVRRALVQHEDEIRNQVFTWFLVLNGFLFAALGFAWSSTTDVVYVLGAVGALSAVSWTAHTVVQALAIDEARGDDDEADESDPPTAGMTSARLRKLGRGYRWLPFLYPWRVLPPLIGAAWIAVIILRAVQ